MDINGLGQLIMANHVEVLDAIKKDQAPTPTQKIYYIADIVRMFKVCRRTVYNWMDSSELEHHRVNSVRFFTQENVDKFISTHKVKF